MKANRFSHLELVRPLAIVQVRATGSNPRRDRIIAITIKRIEPEHDVPLRHIWVNPGVSPELMLQIARITIPGRLVLVPTFLTARHWVRELLDGCDLVGFGLKRFDLPLLQAEFARANDVLDLAGRAIIDCQQIFERLRPSDLEAAVDLHLAKRLEHGASPQKQTRAISALLDALLNAYPFLPRTPAGLSRQFGERELFRHGAAQIGKQSVSSTRPEMPLSERLQAEPDIFYLAWCRKLMGELRSELRHHHKDGGR